MDNLLKENYFLRLVPGDFAGRRAGGYCRTGDDQIARVQFPVGYQFFDGSNIVRLMLDIRPQIPDIDFAYLCPHMLRVYHTAGAMLDEVATSGDPSVVGKYVAILNGQVKSRVLQQAAADSSGQTASVNRFNGANMRPEDRPMTAQSARLERREYVMNTARQDPVAQYGGMLRGRK